MNIGKTAILFFFSLFLPVMLPGQWQPWRDAPPGIAPRSDEVAGRTMPYRLLELTQDELPADTFQILLPRPDGKTVRFHLRPAPVLAPALAGRYPQIHTYAGTGEGGARLRLDRSRRGLQAMVLDPAGDYFIDALAGASHLAIAYYRRDLPAGALHCATAPTGTVQWRDEDAPDFPGDSLRTYRLAVAATGEYTQYHGGTVEGALEAIVTSINRVNGIYERDLAVRLLLVGETDRLLFTDPATDPYTNNNEKRENQEVVDGLIGDRNYDIGHVFGVADKGSVSVAEIESACVEGKKAMGSSRLTTPVGDAFDVDRVAHEIGHQLGARHTFNRCGSQQGARPVEPGSGSTIMTWVGICGEDDLQTNSDAYFHGLNIEEITRYVAAGGGCATATALANAVPAIDPGFPELSLPVRTPFHLPAAATDADGDTLLYSWEQIDVGPSTPVEQPAGTAPLFRSLPPSPDSIRIFPRLEDLLENQTGFGEVLPFYTRSLTFRLSVRDGRGGVAWADHQLQATDAAGPFVVLTQNEAGEAWQGGTAVEIAWAVANTDRAPVDAATVDILLSADGGRSFTIPLAAATPNDGRASVLLPDTLDGDAFRLMVKGSDHLFFDINDVDFSIRPGPTAVAAAPPAPAITLFPNPVRDQLTLRASAPVPAATVGLFTADGRRFFLHQRSTYWREWRLPVGDLPPGVYLLEVRTAGWISLQRFVKAD